MNERGAIGAKEGWRRENGLNFGESLVDEVALGSVSDEEDEFVLGIEVGYFVEFDDQVTGSFADQETVTGDGCLMSNGVEAAGVVSGEVGSKGAILGERGSDVGLPNRFEQIVDAIGLKGFEGVVIEGGGKHDGTTDGRGAKDFETKAVGELDVAEEQIRREVRGKPADGLGHRGELGDDDSLRGGGAERGGELFAGQGLVFDNNEAHGLIERF